MDLKSIQFYETEINSMKDELKGLPEGYLVKRGEYYYQKTDTAQTGITKDPQKVRGLIRKAYLQKRIQHLEHNLSLVKKLTLQGQTEEPQDICRELSAPYQALPIELFFHLSADDWLNNVSGEGAGNPEGLIYRTNSGALVRSKSERTIADALDQNGILWRYEAALVLGNEIRYPDFTIKKPYSGEVVFWEHFGRMDLSGYRQNVSLKIELYTRHGIFPDINLICTYEQHLQNTTHIQNLIEMYLL